MANLPNNYINWTPTAGNIGHGIGPMVEQLRASGPYSMFRNSPLYGAGSPVGGFTPSGGMSAAEMNALRSSQVAAPAVQGAQGALQSAEGAGAGAGAAGEAGALEGGLAGAAEGAGGGALAGFAAKGLLPRLGIGLAAGQVGKAVNDSVGGPSWLGSGLAGAGLGAAIGAPFGGIGAVPGAVVGGLAGLAGGALADVAGIDIPFISGGDNSSSKPAGPNEGDLRKAIVGMRSQMSQSTKAQVNATLRLSKALPADQRMTLLAQTLQQLPTVIGSEAATRAQLKAQVKNQLRVGKMMAAYGNRGVQNAAAYNASIQSLLPGLPAAYQPFAQLQGQQATYDAQNMQNAGVQSVLAGPIQAKFDDQLAQQRQLIQQQQAQNTGGSQDLSSLIAAGG